MGKGRAARLDARNASKNPSISDVQELNLKLQNDLKIAKAEIKSLKKDLAKEKRLRAADRKEIEIEKGSYCNQVNNLKDELQRIQRKWTSEVNALTANYREMENRLEGLGNLVGAVATEVTGDPESIVEFTRKVEEMMGSLETVRSSCTAILQNSETSVLTTCPSCQVLFEEEEKATVVPDPPIVPQEAPTCQICLTGFSDEAGRVPRILRCGHTLCESCAQQIQRNSVLECPFDRIKTMLLKRNARYLPKNFSILEAVGGGEDEN